jgi:hypothetical protein
VLAGSVGFVVHYDQMSPAEQAVVRARWDAGMDRRLAALDLAAEFEAAGESFTELDAKGRAITQPVARGRSV